MLLPLSLLLQLQAPLRTVTDSGVVVNNMRVTPAGVQSVFDGRVASVRFGTTPGEVWVGVPGSAFRISWRDNRVISRAEFNGRTGVHGIAIDAVSGHAIVASVGKLPADVAASRIPGSPPLSRAKSVTQLVTYSNDSASKIITESGGVGAFMAGGPAIAKTANSTGKRVVVLPLPADDALAVIDANTGKLVRSISLGVLPVAAVISDDGNIAWVTVFGGAKPKLGQRSATECCDPSAEPVRVDARGIAEPGTVVRIDLVRGAITHTLNVGLHPTGLAWNQSRQLLYVANGNSDNVSVIDTRNTAVVETIRIAPFKERRIGLSPTDVALTPDGNKLFVSLGGVNAVAVYDVGGASGSTTSAAMRASSAAAVTNTSSATPHGLIPTGWYPSSLDISADGKTLAVGTLFGVGAGTGKTGGLKGKYVFAERGSVNVIPLPTDAELSAFTIGVAENNRLHLATSAYAALAARTSVPARAVPERPGEASAIQHVVYIIKENRTYDQVLGDMGKGASDSSLTMYGKNVTPNAHALSEQFVLLDHFFASGGNSADGHNWLTQANETAYPIWPLYLGRSYPSEGNDPLTYSSGGFIWESAMAKGKNVVSFGEYAPAPKESKASTRQQFMNAFRDSVHSSAKSRTRLRSMYNTHSEIPSLDKILVREYPGWTQEVPDVVKADVLIEHLKEWEAAGAMPDLTLMILPNDHTEGTSAGWCTPRACVADNDYGLGLIVDALSHSSFWKSMAILVVEDDAQDGVDHVDGHRTVAMVASPYAKRHVIDSTFYSHPSMVKTLELMLGLPALSMFDLVATDMRASFIGPDQKPDLTPYSALVPSQSLYDVNVKAQSLNGPSQIDQKNAAVASARMNFREPDAAPTDLLNQILWKDAKGWNSPYPAVKQSLFFPLAVDIADDDRDDDDDDPPVQFSYGAGADALKVHHATFPEAMLGGEAHLGIRFPLLHVGLRFTAEHLLSHSNSIGDTCSGLVSPFQNCQPQRLRDGRAITLGTVGINVRAISSHRLTLDAIGDIGAADIAVDSKGLDRGGKTSDSKTDKVASAGFELGWKLFERLPLAMELSVQAGTLRPFSHDYKTDASNDLENNFSLRRFRIGFSWMPQGR